MAAAIHQTVLSESRSRGQMLRTRYAGERLSANDGPRVMGEVECQIYEAAVNCRRRLARCQRAAGRRSLAVGEQVELVETIRFAAARARSNATYELSLAVAMNGL